MTQGDDDKRAGPVQRGGFMKLVKRLAPILTLAGLLVFAVRSGVHENLSLETLRDNRDLLLAWTESHPLITYLAFMGAYTIVAAIALPGAAILTIIGGFLFGTWKGGAATAFAATFGATILFLAARTAIGDIFRGRISGTLGKFEEGFRENELSYLLILRVVPLFPFWVVNVASAFLGVGARNFVIATAIGILPGTFVYASIGAGVGAVFEAGRDPDLTGLLLNPAIFGPILGLVALSLIPIFYKRFSRRGAGGDPVEGA